MFCPPDRWLVTSQPELHPGPITALTWLSPASSSPIAASPCFALHPESAQLYCNVRPGKSFLSAFTLSAASVAAPAMLEPTAHVPVMGQQHVHACVSYGTVCTDVRASVHMCGLAGRPAGGQARVRASSMCACVRARQCACVCAHAGTCAKCDRASEQVWVSVRV